MHGFRLADRNRLKPFAYARDGFARLSPNIACAVRQLHGFERGSFEGSEAHAAAGIGFPGRERPETSAHLHDGIAGLSPKLKCAVQQLHDVARPHAQRLRFLHMPTGILQDCRRMPNAPCDSCMGSAIRCIECPSRTAAHGCFGPISLGFRPHSPGRARRPALLGLDQPLPVLTSSEQSPTSSDQPRPVPTSPRPAPTGSGRPPPVSAGDSAGFARPRQKSTTVSQFAIPTRKPLETSRCRAANVWDCLQEREGVRARCALGGEAGANVARFPPCRSQSA